MSTKELEPIEPMGAFFDARAAGYDDHMRDNIYVDDTFVPFYRAISLPIRETAEPLAILDLGCGTGLEIEFLLSRVPNARITGIDLSENMLELLRSRYAAHMGQITLVMDSYLTVPFGTQMYDHVISAMSIHHILRDTKLELYRKIHAALKPGGKYVEGDSVVFAETESQCLAEYYAYTADMPDAQDGQYHIDVPFTLERQQAVLLEAGFKDYQLVWQRDPNVDWNFAVYAVAK